MMTATLNSSSWTMINYWSTSVGYADFVAQVSVWGKVRSQSISDNNSIVDFKYRKRIYSPSNASYTTAPTYYNYNNYTHRITCSGHSASATFALGQVVYPANKEWTDISISDTSDLWWGNVAHTSTGTCSITYNATGYRFNGATYDEDGTVVLPTIPRGSTITAFSNFTIESGFSFTYKDVLASRTLTLTCKLSSTTILTKTYTSSVGTHSDTISFTSAQLSTIYSNIGATTKTGTFTLTLATSGISGSDSKTATGTLASATNKPTVGTPTMTETDSGMLTFGVADTEIIRYLSRKKISVTATANHGASISSVSVKNGDNGTAVNMPVESGNTYSAIVAPTVAKFIVSVTDSRGFVTTAEISGTLKEYTYPTVSKIEFDRDSAIVSTGFIRPTGSYWNGTAGNTVNVVQWYYTLNAGTASSMLSATTTNSSWQGATTLADGTLLRDSAYTCEVTVRDTFGQTASAKVSIGIAELSLWLGKYTVRSRYFIGEFFKGIFPVGSIYMSVTNVNPSVYFGGTWEQVAQGRTLIGVGSIEANTVDTHGSVTAGGFNATANERGGTYSHTHGRGNLAAAIGAVDSNVGSIGYYSGGVVSGGPTTTTRYAYGGLEVKPYNDGETYTFNHYTPVYGNTGATNEVTPYLAVYIWKRTA